MSDCIEWYVRNLEAAGRPERPTEDQCRCLLVLSSISATPGTLYNLPTPMGVLDSIVLWHDRALSCLLRTELATYDYDGLTRLVRAAHLHHVRAAIDAWNPWGDPRRASLLARQSPRGVHLLDPSLAIGILEVTLHARSPQGDSRWERHPGPEALVIEPGPDRVAA